MFLQNAGKHLPVTTVSHHRRLQPHNICTKWPVFITQGKKVNHSSDKKWQSSTKNAVTQTEKEIKNNALCAEFLNVKGSRRKKD